MARSFYALVKSLMEGRRFRIWRQIALVLFAIALVITSIHCYHHLYGKKKRHLLIIGCARSGTTYITKVLKKCGYKIGHEIIRKDGVSSWQMTVDTKKVPWGNARKGYRFDHVFHQVRHPLKVIASLYPTEPAQSFEFIREHIPEIKQEDSRLTQCAKYWYYWNLRAEAQAELTYCIEELENIWGELEARLGKKLDQAVLGLIPKTTNTRDICQYYTWKELQQQLEPDLYEKIRTLARRYGYSLDETP
jgi:hypothetical protein